MYTCDVVGMCVYGPLHEYTCTYMHTLTSSLLLVQSVCLCMNVWVTLTLTTYGHMTWEWDKAIRSSVHPLLFAGCYRVLSLFGLDSANAVVSWECTHTHTHAHTHAPTRHMGHISSLYFKQFQIVFPL